MKLVKEHINFERGLSPKDAMNIGIRKKIKDLLSFIHMESIDAQRKFFPDSLINNRNELSALKSFLWYVLFNELSYEVAFLKARKQWSLTKLEQIRVKEIIHKELGISLNESNFQRGLSPKEAMGIGSIEKAVERMITKVWTATYRIVGKGEVKLLRYDNFDPIGYERESELPQGSVIEDGRRNLVQLNVRYENGKVEKYKIINSKYIFDYKTKDDI